MSYGDKSWALCGAASVQGETRDKVLALDKVHCRPGDTPIWNGSLQDFAEVWINFRIMVNRGLTNATPSL
jgi:hypothetical protein